MHFFIKLQPEIQKILFNYQNLSNKQNSLIALTVCLKNNMCEFSTIMIKRNIKTLFIRTNFNCFSFAAWRTSMYTSSEQSNNTFMTSNVHSAHSKNNSDVICFQCQEKEHYVNDCTKSNTNSNNIRVFITVSSKKESAQLKSLHQWNNGQK